MKPGWIELLIRKVLTEKSDHWFIEFFRNGVTSVIAFIVDFGLFFLLTNIAHIHYLISNGISFTNGHVVNYVLSVTWVFKNRKYESRRVELTLFFIIGIVGIAFNELFLWLFTDIAGIYHLTSKIITIVIVYFINYFMKKYILFQVKEEIS